MLIEKKKNLALFYEHFPCYKFTKLLYLSTGILLEGGIFMH